MKKLVLGLIATAGLSSLAFAQTTTTPTPPDPAAPTAATTNVYPFKLRLGGSFALGQPGFGVNFSFANYRLLDLTPELRFGLRARVGVSFADIGTGATVGLAPVLVYFFRNGDVYFGPSLNVGLGGGFAASFGIAGGVEFAIAQNVLLFADTTLDLNPFIISLGTGAEFQITDQLSAFANVSLNAVNTAPYVGFGVGLGYRF
jgi:hypothetical protein